MDLGRVRAASRRPSRRLVLAVATVLGLALALPIASDAVTVTASDATDIRPAPAPPSPPLVPVVTVDVDDTAEGADAHVSADAAKSERQAVRPRPEPPPPPPPAASSASTVWDRLARCESGGNWAHAGGTYHGGLQFHPDTWRRHKLPGYPEYAYQASREQQIEVGRRVQAAQGWAAWPKCSRLLGLR